MEITDPMIGLKFGDITVTEYIGRDKFNKKRYKYQCICGRIASTIERNFKIYQYKCSPNVCRETIIKICSFCNTSYKLGANHNKTLDSKFCSKLCTSQSQQKYKIGQKINDITITDYNFNTSEYIYQCICGRIQQTTTSVIRNLKKECTLRSCGSLYANKFIGKIYSGRKILCFDNNKRNGTFFYAQCKCGQIQSVLISSLLTNKTASCNDCAIRRWDNAVLAGKMRTEYNSWKSMIDRCTNRESKHFRSYGFRGIKVCDNWSSSFDNFFKDMGLRPSKDHQLDRIDPDGNYELNNCRWSTRKENMQNTRWAKKNQWRFVMIDKTKLCKKCIKYTENNEEEEIEIKENLNQMTIS